MKKWTIVFLLLFVGLVAGCSGGGSNPLSPNNTSGKLDNSSPISNPEILAEIDNALNTGKGRIILDAFQILPDPVNGIKIVPYEGRNLSLHYNINRFLKKPYCPISQCYGYEVVDYDPLKKIAMVDWGVYNPTQVTVYDVRVIFTDLFDTDTDPNTGELYKDNDFVILNADGWTKILDNEDLEPDMNPYILFNKEEQPTPVNPNPDRDFAPHTMDIERLVIKLPEVEVEKWPVFFIEASYPDQAEEFIQYMYIDQRPPMDPSITGFSFVSCGLFDHQGEDPDMHVYFSCPKVLGVDADENPIEIEMNRWIIDPEDPVISWVVKVNNVENVIHVGEYPAMIRAVTPNEGDYDTYYKFPFRVRHNPGGPGQTDYDAALAYTSVETGDAEIFVADNIFFTRTFNATEQPDAHDNDSCWAKKGEFWYMYYTSDVNNGQPGQDDLDLYLHVFQLSGTQFDRITEFPYLLTANMLGDERAPCVSPNLDFMVFQGQDGVDGDWEIWRGNFNISDEPTYFTSPTQNITDNGSDDENPTLNMFGNYMLFDSNMYSGSEHDIFGMRPVYASTIDMIIDFGNEDTQPAWNLYNQQFFIFSTQRGDPGEWDIVRAELNGIVVMDVKNLTENMNESDEKHGSWSPSSELIVFQSNEGEGGDWDLWVMDWDGEGKDQLTFNSFDETAACWAPVP